MTKNKGLGQKMTFLEQKHVGCQTKKTPAASLKRRKWGLGLPIHMKNLSILMNMPFIKRDIK